MSLADIDAAIERAQLGWTADTTHVEAEQAFLDRTELAVAVIQLRDAIGGYHSRVTELQDDIDQLLRESSMLNQQMRDMEEKVTAVLTQARWVEVEPGSYINPKKVHWVRRLDFDDHTGLPRCQILLGTTGITVQRNAADVVQQLTGVEQ